MLKARMNPDLPRVGEIKSAGIDSALRAVF
jgi:hypothetical protein